MDTFKQAADQLAKDLHLESLTTEEELILPSNLSAAERHRYLQVILAPFGHTCCNTHTCRACTPKRDSWFVGKECNTALVEERCKPVSRSGRCSFK